MVTTKDVAREAGVSQGTVSNVLNRTGKVSSEKIAKVEAAIRKLGYKANSQAQKLKMGAGKNVAVILPSIEVGHYLRFFETLRRMLFARGIDTMLYISDDIQSIEKECIKRIYEDRPQLIITASCLQTPTPYQEGIPVLFLDRFPIERNSYQHLIGFRYINAGRDIGEYLRKRNCRNIALFTPSASTYDINQMQIGLEESLGSTVLITQFRSDYMRTASKAMEISAESGKFDAIITTDEERARAILDSGLFDRREMPEIITISCNPLLRMEGLKPYILDYGRLGMAAAEAISSLIENTPELGDIIIPPLGFIKEPALPTMHGKHLSIITLDSPSSDALIRLIPDFTRKTGIEVEIETHPYEELYRMLSSDEVPDADLIRVDMAWITEAAERLFIDLDPYNGEIREITDGFLKEISQEYYISDGRMRTLPFDPSVQLMFYNTEAFDNEMTRRLYFEKYREKLAIPDTFEEYDKAAAFFTRSINPSSPMTYGHAITIGTSVAAACDFLPRINRSGKSFHDILEDQETLKALKEYAAAAAATNGKINPWWDSSISSFSKGECAMLRVFMNHAPRITNTKHSQVVGKIGIAEIPGRKPLLGGGAIGINRKSKAIGESLAFLRWVYSDSISRLFTLLGGTSPNAVIYDDTDLLAIYPWLSIAKEGFRIGERRFRIPEEARNQRKLEEIIGYAVRSTTLGAMTAEEALDEARKQYCSL